MTAITTTLVRIHAGDGAYTYAAVRASEALEAIGGCISDGDDADTMPWDVLPGTERRAASHLATCGRRTILIIGTAVGGVWATWHLPIPAPPVPETS